jgi:tripartite tricarboxylate transporter TctB family protein
VRKGQVLFCLLLIAVSGFAIFSASGWTFKAKLFPLSVSIPLLILATAQLLMILFGKEQTNDIAVMDIDFATDVPPELVRRRVIGVFCWIVSFILLVFLLGFPVTVPLFIFLFLKYQSEVSWLTSIMSTAITWGGFYLLFQWLVHIQFQDGAIQTWLGM